jgi:hypothetical protein
MNGSDKLATAPAAGTAAAMKPAGVAQATGVGLKKVAQKTAGDSATSDGLGSAGSNPVLSGSSHLSAHPGANPPANAAPKAAVNSADSPAKPAADGAKPVSPPPNPQPPATEDNPH